MRSSEKRKKADAKPAPHTEKSTMTEPQEEFIEPKGQPSRAASPSELHKAHEDEERQRKQAQK